MLAELAFPSRGLSAAAATLNAEDFEEMLYYALSEYADRADMDHGIQTFKQAGVLTKNRGLVVDIDGATFQVTIVEE